MANGLSVADFDRAKSNLDLLEEVIRGDADATVTYDAAGGEVTVKTLAKALADIIAAGEAAAQQVLDEGLIGLRVTDEAALLADLDFEAGETAIALDTLKVYEKTGASGAGSWELVSDLLAGFAGTASSADVAAVATTARRAQYYPPAPLVANVAGAVKMYPDKDDNLDPLSGVIAIRAGYFQHPTLGRVEIVRSELGTPFAAAGALTDEVFWLVWSQTNPATRFGFAAGEDPIHPNLFTVFLDASGSLRAVGRGADVAYVSAETDIALAVGRKNPAGGIASLQALFVYVGLGLSQVPAPSAGWSFTAGLPPLTVIVGEAMSPIRIRDYGEDPDTDLADLTFSVEMSGSANWLAISDGDLMGGTADAIGQGTYTVTVSDPQGNQTAADGTFTAIVSASTDTNKPPPVWGALPERSMRVDNEITPIDVLALLSDENYEVSSLAVTVLKIPPGLNFDGSEIYGAPSASGTRTLTLRAMNPAGKWADVTRDYSIASAITTQPSIGIIGVEDFASEIEEV